MEPRVLPLSFPTSAEHLALEGIRFQALPASVRVERLCRLIDDGRAALGRTHPTGALRADRERAAADCRARILALLAREDAQ